MKTSIFIFWISLLILFPDGLVSKSQTKGQYTTDGENSNEDSDVDVGKDVALHESFRPRHKYKANGHQTRFHRSEIASNKDQEVKIPHCAVMYKDNEPVGILQPFKESYRFLPVNGDPTLVDINPIPVKRKTVVDVLYPKKINEDYNEEVAENNNQFADDRYPSIFAKFKIDSRLDKILNPDLNLKRSMHKRDAINDERMGSLKNSLSKMTGDNSAVVEEELKNILDDMGLIDDYDNREEIKREIAEDENLEQGMNKINLIKEVHNETRNKRGDVNGTTDDRQNTSPTAQSTSITTAAAPPKAQFEDEHIEDTEGIDLFKADDAKLNEDFEKRDLDISTETVLEELRKKRQFDVSYTKKTDNNEDKRDTADTLSDINLNTTNLVKEAELTQYEKRVEREIRDKIQKLKEEVKEEIKHLKDNPKVNHEESDTRRRKRQVINTLIEEETQDIDPNFNDEQHEGRHVRRKRSSFDGQLIPSKFKIDNNIINLSNSNDGGNGKHKINLNYSNDMLDIKKSEIKKKTSLEENNFSLNSKQKTDKNNNGLRSAIDSGEIDHIMNKKIKSNSLNQEKEHIIEQKSITEKNSFNVTFDTSDIHENTYENRTKTELKIPTHLHLKTFVNDTGKNQNILNVIGEKKHIQNKSCTACQTISKHSNNKIKRVNNGNASLIRIDKHLQLLSNSKHGTNNFLDVGSVKKLPKIETFVPTPKVDIKQFHSNDTLQLHHNKTVNADNMDNFEKKKRFVGINPILENTTNSTHHYQKSNLRQFKNRMTTTLVSHDNINPIIENDTNSKDRYQSRSLKQFDADPIKTNLVNELHIRVKTSREQNDRVTENIANSKIHIRKKRQSKEDTEENDYQYDDPGFNDDVAIENQTYDDQPYANDNDVADNLETNKINSNCNCDKTGNNCKCEAQKADVTMPNIKQDYSDYMENPSKEVEKKSVKHCNCDKNGRHCKCQTLTEDSQYTDYAEEQPIEKKSDLYENGIADELQNGVEERAPRRPRQQRRHAGISMENSNVDHLSEDYYESYESGQNKPMKREVQQNKEPRNQQFENGEYFVDLHPNIYRLTPVETSREKRDSFKNLVAIHGGGPAMSHLVAIRQRSMLPHSRFRRRVQNDDNREPRQLIDMSDEDIFGALPQSFAGELARYKRVKRGKIEK